MRVVSGTLRGRRFDPPESFDARPTTDFAKENLFNVLCNIVDFEYISVLDLFGGSGSISYEFASRGCADITCVEKSATHQRFISRTVDAFGISDSVKVIRGDAIKFISSATRKYDLIFADPPYSMPEVDEIPDLVISRDILSKDGFFILEHSGAGRFNSHANFWQTRAYGKVNFTFFRTMPLEQK
ncbi:MAG: RsmD family RNA methyltransferase [Marinilabiliaceae bacterium]